MNYTIGDTPMLRDISQSRWGDFLWTLTFIDVDPDTGAESDTDLTGCDFIMIIYEQDATTVKKTLAVGTGITVTGNDVQVAMENADFDDWTKGCKFPYHFTYETAAGHVKCLFEGKFMIV